MNFTIFFIHCCRQYKNQKTKGVLLRWHWNLLSWPVSVYFENLLNKEFKRKLSVFLQHSLSFAFTWLKDITVVEFLALTKHSWILAVKNQVKNPLYQTKNVKLENVKNRLWISQWNSLNSDDINFMHEKWEFSSVFSWV